MLQTNQNRLNPLVESLDEYGSTTGFQSISKSYYYLKRKRYVLHVFWITITVSFLAMMFQQLADLRKSMIDDPIKVTWSEIENGSLKFPNIIFCQPISMDPGFKESYGIDTDLEEYMLLMQRDNKDFKGKNNSQEMKRRYRAFRNRHPSDNWREILFQAVTVPCPSFFDAIYDMGQKLPNHCDRGDSIVPMVSHTKFCYLFRHYGTGHDNSVNVTNSLERIAQYTPGFLGALDFTVNILDRPEGFLGIYVSFSYPQLPINELKILIAPGHQAIIGLNMESVIRYSKLETCATNESINLGYANWTFFKQYTQNTCTYACFTIDVMENCSCMQIGWNISKPETIRWCEGFDFYECYLPRYMKLEPWTYRKELEKCSTKCPPACHETRFLHDLSVTYLEMQNKTTIKIYYNKLSIQSIIKTEMYPFSKVLSTFGGIMSFWFGASILAVIHLFVWLIDFVCLSIRFISRNRSP